MIFAPTLEGFLSEESNVKAQNRSKLVVKSSKLMFFGLIAVNAVLPTAHAKVDRPPQYVVLALDGSKSNSMWEETRAFARNMTAQGKPLKWTYFINTAYLLTDAAKTSYDAPRAGRGKSAIGFGGKMSDVLTRFKEMNMAQEEGNEIANHASGHFDGSKWIALDWRQEFDQFYSILKNLFSFNNVPAREVAKIPSSYSLDPSEITGFRAPQFGRNEAMYETLPSYGLIYDTSDVAKPDAWPSRNRQGTWKFPLASIPIAGTAKKTLSMDYNFYYAQSNGVAGPPEKAKDFEEQMYQSYVNYFYGNYNGNRAPVNIGHHFSKWNKGAYWNALQRFANLVCGQPEVKCVTYSELVEFMNQVERTPRLVQAYAAGDFEKSSYSRPLTGRRAILPKLHPAVQDDQLMIADPPEAHDE